MSDGSAELSQTGRFDWNPSTRELSWPQETARIAGYDPTTKPSLELCFERIHPEDRCSVKTSLLELSR